MIIIQSIRPRWVEQIAMGNKNAELRRTKPTAKLPIKVLIYQTKEDWYYDLLRCLGNGQLARKLEKAKGKIIGEYTCNEIVSIKPIIPSDGGEVTYAIDKASEDARLHLSNAELNKYLEKGNGYVWLMSNIKIYDKPQELNEYVKYPPQSWRYVREK